MTSVDTPTPTRTRGRVDVPRPLDAATWRAISKSRSSGRAPRRGPAISRRRAVAIVALAVGTGAVVFGTVAIGSERGNRAGRTDIPSTSSSASPAPSPDALSAMPSTSPVDRPVLGTGSAGADVAELQEILRELGFDPGVTDANFGPTTADAVRAFQASVGVTVDGVVGPQTWVELEGRRALEHTPT